MYVPGVGPGCWAPQLRPPPQVVGQQPTQMQNQNELLMQHLMLQNQAVMQQQAFTVQQLEANMMRQAAAAAQQDWVYQNFPNQGFHQGFQQGFYQTEGVFQPWQQPELAYTEETGVNRHRQDESGAHRRWKGKVESDNKNQSSRTWRGLRFCYGAAGLFW